MEPRPEQVVHPTMMASIGMRQIKPMRLNRPATTRYAHDLVHLDPIAGPCSLLAPVMDATSTAFAAQIRPLSRSPNSAYRAPTYLHRLKLRLLAPVTFRSFRQHADALSLAND